MKIALLSFEYPPETGFGGIGTYTWYQARGLARLGHEVHVLAGATDPTNLRESEHDGVKVYRYRAEGTWMRQFQRLSRFNLRWTKSRLENGLSMRRGLRALLETNRYDLAEMPECGADGLLIAGRIGIPTLVKFHSPAKLIMGNYDVPRADRFLCSRVEQVALRRATAFTSASEFLAKEARQLVSMEYPWQTIPRTGVNSANQKRGLVPKLRPYEPRTLILMGDMPLFRSGQPGSRGRVLTFLVLELPGEADSS